MRKTLFVHIGYHKTGTTSIQNFFWNNRKALEKEGLLYPEIGLSWPSHAQLALSLSSERDKFARQITSADLSGQGNSYTPYQGEPADELYSELGCEIDKTICDKVIVSSECFLEWVNPAEIKRLINAYCDCDIKIVIYILRQDIWIQSVFAQVIKDPHIRFAGKMEDLPQNSWLDYFETISNWAKIYGPENIILRRFTDSIKLANGSISDILNVVGLDDNEAYKYPMIRETNKGLDYRKTMFLHALNKQLAGSELFQLILETFAKEKTNPLQKNRKLTHMLYEDALTLYNSFSESNKKLGEYFFNGVEPFEPPTRDEYQIKKELSYDWISRLTIEIERVRNHQTGI